MIFISILLCAASAYFLFQLPMILQYLVAHT